MDRFPDCDPLLQLRLLQLDADPALELVDVADRVETEHADRSAIRVPQSFDAFHRRRLAGAVWAQEAENLAALDLEADVVDGRHAAVAFREVLNLDHV